MSMRFLPLVLALSACTQAAIAPEEGPVALTPVFEKPEGYPYPLGDLSGTIGAAPLALKSYDYSVGAIDPAVWVQEMDGARRMRATFESATDPEADGPELTVLATPPAALAKGMRFPATVEWTPTAGAPALRSITPAEMVITGFTEGGSGSYDRITAMVSGAVCPATGDCLPLALTLRTGVYQNDW